MTLLQFILIQVNLGLLFVLFKWLAAKNGQFTFNRWYLLLGPAIAIILPFIVLEPSADTALAVMLPAIELLQETQTNNTTFIDWTQLGLIAGGMTILITFGYSMWRLLGIKRATYQEDFKGKQVYLLDSEEGTTHSLFNRIYLHPSHQNYREIILEHEYAHCQSRHTWDLILLVCYKALFWYHPAIYRWGKEMQLNHEYLADAHVLSQGIPAKAYGETLLALNFSHCGGSLVHAFNQPSFLRKRIVHFKHQNKFNMKHLLLIPAIAALALGTTSMVSTTSQEQTPNAISTVTSGDEATTEPEYPGGKEGLMKYLMDNLTYPKDLEADGAEGKVFVKFIISKSGEVKKVAIARSSGFAALDAEAIRVIQNMQSWTPGTKEGKKIATEMTLPIVFKLAK